MRVTASEKLANAKPRGFSALGQSYAADLRGWVVRRAAGYGIAAALMLGGVMAVFGAIVVGAIALFHFLELRYGTNIAFAALGGGLLALAAILLLAGWLTLQRRAPLPRPERQFRAAKQMMMGSTISRAVTAMYDVEAARPDATTQVLLGAAAVAAIGWLVISHLGSASPRPQVRR
jgi:MFS family permease